MPRPSQPLSPPLSLRLASEDATRALAARMAQGLRAGDTLLLQGPIGAGKTFFARALIRTLLARAGRVEEVPSPTFTLVQTYEAGALEIWHADLYRLTSADEVTELGLEDAFDTALCLVEWPDRLGDLAPPDALALRFSAPGEAGLRIVEMSGPARWGAMLADLAREFPDAG